MHEINYHHLIYIISTGQLLSVNYLQYINYHYGIKNLTIFANNSIRDRQTCAQNRKYSILTPQIQEVCICVMPETFTCPYQQTNPIACHLTWCTVHDYSIQDSIRETLMDCSKFHVILFLQGISEHQQYGHRLNHCTCMAQEQCQHT